MVHILEVRAITASMLVEIGIGCSHDNLFCLHTRCLIYGANKIFLSSHGTFSILLDVQGPLDGVTKSGLLTIAPWV